MIQFIKRRKKPILGLIISAITYVAALVGLELDPELSAGIALAVFTAVVERLRPIFGEPAETPRPRRS